MMITNVETNRGSRVTSMALVDKNTPWSTKRLQRTTKNIEGLEGVTYDQNCLRSQKYIESKLRGATCDHNGVSKKRRQRPNHKPEGATCDHDGGSENNTPMTTVSLH